MPYEDHCGLRVYRFTSFPSDDLAHGLFTRRGGVSGGPWATLNVGGNIGDDPQRVAENRRRILSHLARPQDSTFDVWQVHAATILHAKTPRGGPPYPRADGLMSDSPDVTLVMRFADCVPILLFDVKRRAVGLVHAGWKGTVLQAARRAVEAMQRTFGSAPADMVAGIGPAIAGHHYPVGPEVVNAFRDSFGEEASNYLWTQNGEVHFDLPGANSELLRRAGVVKVEQSQICTACDPMNWFSHRGENGRTGRFAAVLALRKEARI